MKWRQRWIRWAARVAAPCSSNTRKESQRISASLDEVIERRVRYLTDYRDAGYAKDYAGQVARVRSTEARVMPGSTAGPKMSMPWWRCPGRQESSHKKPI